MAVSAVKGKGTRHWLGRLSFGGVSIVVAAVLVLCYFSVVINPAKAWMITLVGLLYPIVLPLAIVLFVWALIRRSMSRFLSPTEI